MILSFPKARLITFFKTRLIKFYLNSLLMTDPICPMMQTSVSGVDIHKIHREDVCVCVCVCVCV